MNKLAAVKEKNVFCDGELFAIEQRREKSTKSAISIVFQKKKTNKGNGKINTNHKTNSDIFTDFFCFEYFVFN